MARKRRNYKSNMNFPPKIVFKPPKCTADISQITALGIMYI